MDNTSGNNPPVLNGSHDNAPINSVPNLDVSNLNISNNIMPDATFLPNAAMSNGGALFVMSFVEGQTWQFGVMAADAFAREAALKKADDAGVVSYTYTQFRVDLWLISCILSVVIILVIIYTYTTLGPNVALGLVLLYTIICMFMSNSWVIAHGVLTCYDQ